MSRFLQLFVVAVEWADLVPKEGDFPVPAEAFPVRRVLGLHEQMAVDPPEKNKENLIFQQLETPGNSW